MVMVRMGMRMIVLKAVEMVMVRMRMIVLKAVEMVMMMIWKY